MHCNFCKCIVITREFKKEDGSVCVELCLTFKKGVVIECPHCGHHMWRDGFTDYVKLILNLEDGSCCDPKPYHLQKLRCSNPNCSSHRVRKDNPGKHKDVLHETHVMLPEHGLPRYEVQAGNFDDFQQSSNKEYAAALSKQSDAYLRLFFQPWPVE